MHETSENRKSVRLPLYRVARRLFLLEVFGLKFENFGFCEVFVKKTIFRSFYFYNNLVLFSLLLRGFGFYYRPPLFHSLPHSLTLHRGHSLHHSLIPSLPLHRGRLRKSLNTTKSSLWKALLDAAPAKRSQSSGSAPEESKRH